MLSKIRRIKTVRKTSTGPRYIHDCKQCKFLGRYGDRDLYWCVDKSAGKKHHYLDSMIARGGSDGPDYASSMPTSDYVAGGIRVPATGWKKVIQARAKKLGIIPAMKKCPKCAGKGRLPNTPANNHLFSLICPRCNETGLVSA